MTKFEMLVINQVPTGYRTSKKNGNRKHTLKDCTSSSKNISDDSSLGEREVLLAVYSGLSAFEICRSVCGIF